MSKMFADCYELRSVILPKFDFDNVHIDMDDMYFKTDMCIQIRYAAVIDSYDEQVRSYRV